MFSDLTRYVTMQNLFHDGGFSTMGMNPALVEVKE
jgi:enoyl-[acyl-carrier protein] reductase I